MLCRIEMPTNEQIFSRFFRYNLLHSPARANVLLLPLFMLALAAGLYFLGLSIWLIGLVLLLTAAYLVYQLYLRPTAIFRQKSGIALQTEVYIFTENGYTRTVRSEEGGLPDNTHLRYDALLKAAETQNDFYLYYRPGHAHLVDKTYFTKGEPAELRETLRAALGEKFKTSARF